MISKQCNETDAFPSKWKAANIVPIRKKGDKQTLKNYRPLSRLPICGKVLERLLFKLFRFDAKMFYCSNFNKSVRL